MAKVKSGPGDSHHEAGILSLAASDMPDSVKSRKHVTIADVARESGFSSATVSIALNEAPLSKNLTDRTKEHIRNTAKRLGYRPDAYARSLRNRRRDTIGVVVLDLSDPFCSQILRGIDHTLQMTKYLPLVMNANHDRRQLKRYFELLVEHRVEGLIVVANWILKQDDLAEHLRTILLPTTLVGRDLSIEGVRSILVDNEQGGYAALAYLQESGHGDIAVLRGPEALIDSRRRWQGMQRCARERGIRLSPELVRQLPDAVDPDSVFEDGLALTQDLLRTGRHFTALAAFDDLTALGAVRALHAAGLRVPEDCSIIGFDDVPPAWLSTPPLTTLRQPMQEMGQLAARCVLSEIRGDSSAQHASLLQCLPATLIRRGSTRPGA